MQLLKKMFRVCKININKDSKIRYTSELCVVWLRPIVLLCRPRCDCVIGLIFLCGCCTMYLQPNKCTGCANCAHSRGNNVRFIDSPAEVKRRILPIRRTSPNARPHTYGAFLRRKKALGFAYSFSKWGVSLSRAVEVSTVFFRRAARG